MMRMAALALISLSSAALAAPAWARTPVVVELYTSQGCASCVKAGDVLAGLADKPPILTLTFSVDIWDYLGWSDTLAKPEFAARQRAYMGRLNLSEVYTPQVVIDGRSEIAAVSPDQIAPLISKAAKAHGAALQIQFRKNHVAVGSGPAPSGGGEVWLVRYDPHDETVLVKSGENRGKTLLEHHVVRELARLGAWSGRSHVYDLPDPSADGLQTAVLVQGTGGGRILGVAER